MKPPKARHTISKVLSANDTGDTGGHQSGILVPKVEGVLSFFPELDPSLKNPRAHLKFIDDEGYEWLFAFIYYNNRFFGGTRNEYRLTRMMPYFRQNNLRPGDEVILSKDVNDHRYITYKKSADRPMVRNGILRIGKEWKVVRLKEK